MTQEPDWSARLALSVAREVRRHRQAQGLSAQQLSDRCAAVGMPIQRSVLANLESGRRTTVTIAEVLVLARALGVPPGVLIFPVGYERQVEVLPGARQEPLVALDWLSGFTAFSSEESRAISESALGIIRQHEDLVMELRRFRQEERFAHERAAANKEIRASVEPEIINVEAGLQAARLRLRGAENTKDIDPEKLTSLEAEVKILERQLADMVARIEIANHTEGWATRSSEMRAAATEKLASFRREMRERGFYSPALASDIDLGDIEEEQHADEGQESLFALATLPHPEPSVRRLSKENRRKPTEVTVDARALRKAINQAFRDLEKLTGLDVRYDNNEEE